MRRPLPNFTWQNLAPPYDEYEYFQDHERYPFNPYAENFDLVNAWWLAEAATLAYADEAFVRDRFAQAGFPELWYFKGQSTDCFLVANDDVAILVFRGTESRPRPGAKGIRNIWADIRTDLDALPVDAGHGMKVHQGFQRALDEVWQGLLLQLEKIHRPSRTVWMTGHSLGAALATLAAERYQKVQGLYTFGSPRVGDTCFRDRFPVHTYRLVHNNDIVTELPFPGIYFHVGELCYIDSQGKLHHESNILDMIGDGIRAEARNVKQAFEESSLGEFRFIPGGIKDHMPLFYALHLWNVMQESEAGAQ